MVQCPASSSHLEHMDSSGSSHLQKSLFQARFAPGISPSTAWTTQCLGYGEMGRKGRVLELALGMRCLMRAGFTLWKETSPLAATFPGLWPWGFAHPCHGPQGVNSGCLWGLWLSLDNPGMSPLWGAQGGAEAASPLRSSGFVFPLPEDALGGPLQFALGFSTAQKAHGAFGEDINGWQPAALPSAPSPRPQEREGAGTRRWG